MPVGRACAMRRHLYVGQAGCNNFAYQTSLLLLLSEFSWSRTLADYSLR